MFHKNDTDLYPASFFTDRNDENRGLGFLVVAAILLLFLLITAIGYASKTRPTGDFGDAVYTAAKVLCGIPDDQSEDPESDTILSAAATYIADHNARNNP